MFGIAIRNYLKTNGITSTFLATNLNMSDMVISSMLAGKRKIKIEEYVAICNILKVDFDYFYKIVNKQ